MRNKEEMTNYLNRYKNQDENYKKIETQKDPDWQFQKVQSVYEVTEQLMRNPYGQNHQYEFKGNVTPYNLSQTYKNTKNINNIWKENDRKYTNIIGTQKIQRQKNKSSNANTQTNALSQNSSMEYISSEQPSFSNKGQFTVFEDLNLNHISPVKQNYHKVQIMDYRKDWQTVSFAPSNKNKIKLIEQKCIKVYEYIQELKFMKEGFQSKLKQQRIYFANQLQEIKKFLFKLNIKYEKDLLQYSKSKFSNIPFKNSNASNIYSQNDNLLVNKQNQLIQLKNYCQKLQENLAKSQQKYQSTLKIYQQEIELISKELQTKMQLQQKYRQSQIYTKNFSSTIQGCSECERSKQQIQQAKSFYSYEIQIWKGRLQEQQQKHSISMRRLEQKVFSLQQQFQNLQKNKIQAQKKLKQKQKQVQYRQSQIQYRLKDIERRQRQIEMKQKYLEKQKGDMQRKKQKLSDYEFKILKQQKKLKNQFKQREQMTSQYFNNCQKRNILGRSNAMVQRSDSRTSKSSKVDINTRLKQIQMMRTSGVRNCLDNGTSRNSSRDNKISSIRQINANSPKFASTINLKQYSSSSSSFPHQGQYEKKSNQMIKLSQKLTNLTQNLQKELREIN